MTKSYILLSNVSSELNDVKEFSELVNQYGFMMIFCVIIIIMGIILFLNYNRISSSKNKSELDLLIKEREASINQNKDMFKLVTEVQTNQVAELKEMTDTLRDMNNDIKSTKENMKINTENVSKMTDSMASFKSDHEHIFNMLTEVLEYVKANETANNEILMKVKAIEALLDKPNNT